MLQFLAKGSVCHGRLRISVIWTAVESAVTQPDLQCIPVMVSAYPPPRAAMVSALTLSTNGSVLERKNVLTTGKCVLGLGGCVLLTRETPGVCVRTLPGEEKGVVYMR